MRSLIVAFLLPLLTSPALASSGAHWTETDLAVLDRWVDAAPADALPRPSTKAFDAAVRGGDPMVIDREATKLALRLARMHLLGDASSAEKAGWNIVDTDRNLPVESLLDTAITTETLDSFFAWMRPASPQYAALKAAYDVETDRGRRRTIARNMERWRWMPRSLGDDYVLVNAADFEAYLWRDGKEVGTWRVIVGKKSTPTPVFDTTIEGVILNPWWEIPASIVRESVGALIRRNPALARSRGYVWADGRYRQRPGPNNALGQMKLVMPNRFSVYMHDTPSKQLFERDVRAFSHGCIRTGDAIGFAATLLEGVKTREEVDAIVSSGATTEVALARPIPIYVTYFTAVGDGQGDVAVLPDIYDRDGRIKLSSVNYSPRSLRADPAVLARPQSSSEATGVRRDLLTGIEC
ncbi:L,D-transpeptidase family protein [Tsuneonella mangrovi]|uniref:L,D-transpeptidase family protein n=1 Tax=Tsuneonella mangrovi TaxID=1982042 RepID=UPI00147244A5|nr:L,D-transpeptidase family protein [Tsuneonella mangrovi]